MRVLPDAVCWHEGMQLLPQHFQLQGLRAEVLAEQLAQAANPWFWGLFLLDLDRTALSGGLVRIRELEAILPDGLPVRLARDAKPLEFDAREAIEATAEKTTTIYLAITPLARSGRLLPLKGRMDSLQGAAVPDLASGEFPEPIPVWQPHLRVLDESSRSDSVCLPLLRIAREAGGYVQCDYVAPTPRIGVDSLIGRRLESICLQAREKCLSLAGRLRQAQRADRLEDVQEIRRQLAALWMRLPEVEALLGSGVVGPLQLHAVLCGMAGSWSALAPQDGVPLFAALDYFDLLAGFRPVLDWLDGCLQRIHVGYRRSVFERQDDDFILQLPGMDLSERRLVIGLRMPAGSGERDAREWLERSVVASESFIPALVRQRMRGLAVRPLDRREQIAYGVGDETHLFVVHIDQDWFQPAQRLLVKPPRVATGQVPEQLWLFYKDEVVDTD